MDTDARRRHDWIVGVLALVTLIDLLELPWYTAAGGTVSGITLPSISNPATGSPTGVLGILAVLATLAILLEVVFARLSADTKIPSVGGNRTTTRWVLALIAAFFFALKFVLNLSKIGNMGVGFWLGVPLLAALVYFTTQVRGEEYPVPDPVAVEAKRKREEEEKAEEEKPEPAESQQDEGDEEQTGRDEEQADRGEEKSEVSADDGEQSETSAEDAEHEEERRGAAEGSGRSGESSTAAAGSDE